MLYLNMVKRGKKVDFSDDKALPKKSTKKVGSVKQRGELTRRGYKDVPNDNPDGKEAFEELLAKMITPQK
jgi:hypothetical protein